MSMSDEDRAMREARQHSLNLVVASQDTDDLRKSEQPRWQRLRRRLEQEGIAVEDAAVADRGTEDHALESGLVITRDDRAFSFEFDFLRDEDGQGIEYEDARVTGWNELDEKRRNIYARRLRAGREILRREDSAGKAPPDGPATHNPSD